MRPRERSVSNRLHAILFHVATELRGEGEMRNYFTELGRFERGQAAEFSSRQRDRVNRALRRAYDSVPYYRARWSKADVSFEGMRNLPTLSKLDLQGNFEELRSNLKGLRVTSKTTGGSTGQAITLLKDRDALAREMAATWLAYGWNGVRIGDSHARFWGTPTTARRKIRSLAVAAVANRYNFSAFAFDEHDLEKYWNQIARLRPAFFYGYVSMIEAFAAHITARGHDGRSLGLKAIITTSEVLSAPQRRIIDGAFGAPVQNEYGCGEVGPIAYECEKGMLHLMAENLYVELLREDGAVALPGETGEVVVTDLHNRAMPLVRYRVGDFAVQGDGCSCGRVWPTLAGIWGREYDFVIGQDGRKYHGEYIMYLFEDLRVQGVEVSQFQVIQRSRGSATVNIVVKPELLARVEDKVVRAFAARLPGLDVHVRAVESINRTASGKIQLIRNDVLRAGANE